MDVNDDAGCLKDSHASTLITSRLAPAGWIVLPRE